MIRVAIYVTCSETKDPPHLSINACPKSTRSIPLNPILSLSHSSPLILGGQHDHISLFVHPALLQVPRQWHTPTGSHIGQVTTQTAVRHFLHGHGVFFRRSGICVLLPAGSDQAVIVSDHLEAPLTPTTMAMSPTTGSVNRSRGLMSLVSGIATSPRA